MAERARRILHVIAHLEKGGAERQLRLLIGASRHEHAVALLRRNVVEGPEEVVPLDDLSFVRNIGRIRRGIDRFRADLVHLWLPERLTVPGMIAAKLARKPIVAGDRRKPRDYGTHAIRDRLDYLTYLGADVIVPNYPILPKARSLARVLGFRRKTEVIPNGVVRRPALGVLPGFPAKILFVGRLVEQKRVDRLIRAMPALAEAGVARLDIVGEGEERGRLEALARATGAGERIAFHGARRDWWQAFGPASHVLMLPSLSEGMSNTVFEAIDLGYAVAMTRTPEAEEIFRPMGAAPVWIGPGDGGVAGAWGAVAGLGAEGLIARIAALRTGLDHYSVEAMAARYDALYERLVP